MTKEEFLNLELFPRLGLCVDYKGKKHWVLGKDVDECLLRIVEEENNGTCLMHKKKMVRFENCSNCRIDSPDLTSESLTTPSWEKLYVDVRRIDSPKDLNSEK